MLSKYNFNMKIDSTLISNKLLNKIISRCVREVVKTQLNANVSKNLTNVSLNIIEDLLKYKKDEATIEPDFSKDKNFEVVTLCLII